MRETGRSVRICMAKCQKPLIFYRRVLSTLIQVAWERNTERHIFRDLKALTAFPIPILESESIPKN